MGYGGGHWFGLFCYDIVTVVYGYSINITQPKPDQYLLPPLPVVPHPQSKMGGLGYSVCVLCVLCLHCLLFCTICSSTLCFALYKSCFSMQSIYSCPPSCGWLFSHMHIHSNIYCMIMDYGFFVFTSYFTLFFSIFYCTEQEQPI